MQTQNLSLSRVYFLRITIEIFSMDNEPLQHFQKHPLGLSNGTLPHCIIFQITKVAFGSICIELCSKQFRIFFNAFRHLLE
jgi:hypothetical protein